MKAKLPPEYYWPAQKKELFDALVEQRANEKAKQQSAFTVDIMVLGIARLLVNKHGWGTGDKATRLKQLFADLEELIASLGERYDDDCVLVELRRWARENGVIYTGRAE